MILRTLTTKIVKLIIFIILFSSCFYQSIFALTLNNPLKGQEFRKNFFNLTNDSLANILNLKQDVIEYKLPNGFTVILHRDTTCLGVFAQVAVKVGFADEPPNAPNLLKLTRKLIVQGNDSVGSTDSKKESIYLERLSEQFEAYRNAKESEKSIIWKDIIRINNHANEFLATSEMSRLMELLGVRDMKDFSTLDGTFFNFRIPTHQLENWFKLLGFMFNKPTFRGLIKEQNKILLEEIDGRAPNLESLLDSFSLKTYKKSNLIYTEPINEKIIENLPSLKQVTEFYDKHFHADQMAIILVGDFKLDQVKTWIKGSFDSIPKNDLTNYANYKQLTIKDKQVLNPLYFEENQVLLGYISPKYNHPDALPLMVAGSIFSNDYSVGTLDSLKHKKWLSNINTYYMGYRSLSNNIISYTPSTMTAHKFIDRKIFDTIDSTINGVFEDTLIVYAKKQVIGQIYEMTASAEQRCATLAQNFTSDITWQAFSQFPINIYELDRKQIVKTMNKYFKGPLFYCNITSNIKQKNKVSKYLDIPIKNMGYGRSSKIGYKLINNVIENMQTDTAYFENYRNQFNEIQLSWNQNLYYVQKKHLANFDFVAKYQVGSSPYQSLEIICKYLMNVGTLKKPEQTFKQQFFDLGCKYSFKIEDGYLQIRVQGLNSSFIKSLELIYELIHYHDRDAHALQKLISLTQVERSDELVNPDKLGLALQSYLLHKSASPYKQRISSKVLDKLDVYFLRDTLRKAMELPANFHYVGDAELHVVHGALVKLFGNNIKTGTLKKVSKKIAYYKEPTILFLNNTTVRDAHLYYYVPGGMLNIDSLPLVDAFNQYFGNNENSILQQVFQDHKSIARSVNASYDPRNSLGFRGVFTADVVCPANKTTQVIREMNSLLKNIPIDSVRLISLPSALINACYTTTTNQNNITEEVHEWKRIGYLSNPSAAKVERFRTITPEEIIKFYKVHLRNKPITIAILGNKKYIDMKKLEKFGKLIYLKPSEIISK